MHLQYLAILKVMATKCDVVWLNEWLIRLLVHICLIGIHCCKIKNQF